jgi:hypothetical protein
LAIVLDLLFSGDCRELSRARCRESTPVPWPLARSWERVNYLTVAEPLQAPLWETGALQFVKDLNLPANPTPRAGK